LHNLSTRNQLILRCIFEKFPVQSNRENRWPIREILQANREAKRHNRETCQGDPAGILSASLLLIAVHGIEVHK